MLHRDNSTVKDEDLVGRKGLGARVGRSIGDEEEGESRSIKRRPFGKVWGVSVVVSTQSTRKGHRDTARTDEVQSRIVTRKVNTQTNNRRR